MPATALTAADWDRDVLDSPLPVLVDFWATWCGPCRQTGPVLDAIQDDLADLVSVRKVDVDEEKQLTAAQRIRSVPTLRLFVGGEVVAELIGAHPRAEIEQLIRAHSA